MGWLGGLGSNNCGVIPGKVYSSIGRMASHWQPLNKGIDKIERLPTFGLDNSVRAPAC